MGNWLIFKVIDDLRIYEDGPFETGNWAERNLYGGDGIAFIEDLFEDTHFVVRSYNKQGFVILLPVNKTGRWVTGLTKGEGCVDYLFLSRQV